MWVYREWPSAFAGLRKHDLAAIVAGGPNSLMRPIHGRMPVILSLDEYAPWLDHSMSVWDLHTMLTLREWREMVARPSTAWERMGRGWQNGLRRRRGV